MQLLSQASKAAVTELLSVPRTVRFAPSPSGSLHLGNISTYLINWLIAQKSSGEVVLRIEDLDPDRSRTEYAERIKHDLTVLGLTWDKEVQPQSERSSLYEDYFELLKEKAHIYPCFCSRSDRRAASAPHKGEYEHLVDPCSLVDPNDFLAQNRGVKPSWRIHLEGSYEFKDVFHGSYLGSFSEMRSDTVLRRKDGVYAYNLAVAVDDALQGIDCVCRGFDLLEVSPLQSWIIGQISGKLPVYAHTPLVVDTAGIRLSKRHNSASIEMLLNTLGSPEALFGELAFLLGLIPRREAISLCELTEDADLSQLCGKTQIVFNA